MYVIYSSLFIITQRVFTAKYTPLYLILLPNFLPLSKFAFVNNKKQLMLLNNRCAPSLPGGCERHLPCLVSFHPGFGSDFCSRVDAFQKPVCSTAEFPRKHFIHKFTRTVVGYTQTTFWFCFDLQKEEKPVELQDTWVFSVKPQWIRKAFAKVKVETGGPVCFQSSGFCAQEETLSLQRKWVSFIARWYNPHVWVAAPEVVLVILIPQTVRYFICSPTLCKHTLQ